MDAAVGLAIVPSRSGGLVGAIYGSGHLVGGVAGAAATLGGAASGVGGVGGVAVLPYTGFSLIWCVLLAAMFFAVGTSLLHAAHTLGRLRRGDRPECVPATLSGNQSHDPAD